jgi:hypothetical protein
MRQIACALDQQQVVVRILPFSKNLFAVAFMFYRVNVN